VIAECDAVEQFLNSKIQEQEKLPKQVDPVLTVATMKEKKAEIEKLVQNVLNKPKPAPPKKEEPKKSEPKKEEPKKEEPKANGDVNMDDAAKQQQQQQQQQQSGNKKTAGEMDLD
jgi:hypothetical protein